MATLKDVARVTGLTVGTVSRVLNNRGYISEKTRKKVYQAMKDLNYRPNEMARSLSKQKNNTIGVIVPHIVHPYFAKVISSLETAAYEHKYKLLLFNSKGKEDREEEYIEMCRSNRVAGVVLCSSTFHTEKFRNLGFPVVTLERSIDEAAAGIECDNYRGGILATEHLIERGCKCLLHIGGVAQNEMPADQRNLAFEEVCRKNGVEFYSTNLEKALYDDLDYYQLIRRILREHPQIDGVFASSDLIAAQVLQVCREKGVEVPSQVKVVGFDDVNVAALTTPTITTIHQPVKEMAQAAISAVVRIEEGEAVPVRSVFPVTLVQREST